MVETLPFAYLVLVLAALGAATMRVFLPNAAAFRADKARLEILAWMFSGGAALLWTALILLRGIA